MTATLDNTTTSLPWLDSLLQQIAGTRVTRPIAVFDCDGTIIKGDIGEAMFFNQFEQGLFRVSPADVWPDYPEKNTLDRLFREMKSRDAQAAIEFAKLLLDWYFGQLKQGKTAKACSDIVRLLSGFSVEEVRTHARETLNVDLHSPVAHRSLGGYSLPKGIRYIRETVDILRRLVDSNFELWVISGSNRWAVEAVFSPFGVPTDRIIGIEAIETGGILTSEIREPVPVLQGKVEILRKLLPNRPEIVLSDSLRYDLPLLEEASHVRVHVLSNPHDNRNNVDTQIAPWVQLKEISYINGTHPWQM